VLVAVVCSSAEAAITLWPAAVEAPTPVRIRSGDKAPASRGKLSHIVPPTGRMGLRWFADFY
jgi:hypothetical protein